VEGGADGGEIFRFGLGVENVSGLFITDSAGATDTPADVSK